MNQITAFVEGLELPSVDTDSSGIYSIITSVPSPWARAYMMNNALKITYIPIHQKEHIKGMNTLYSALQDEYKGLLTTMALYNSNIKVQKVDLQYNQDLPDDQLKQALSFVDNIYEVSGAFGNMLFDPITKTDAF